MHDVVGIDGWDDKSYEDFFAHTDDIALSEEDVFGDKESIFLQGRDEKEKLEDRLRNLEKAVKLRGLGEFFALRRQWSKWIIGWITALVAFHAILALLVGLALLDYSEYEWFITAITVETFLQIVGMGFVAVKFLFSDPKDEKV